MFFSSHSCFRENSVLTPRWNWFFDLLFGAFVAIIIHNSLPQRILLYVLLLKSICSEPCPSIDGRKEDICTLPCLRLTILGDIFKINGLFSLFPHHRMPPPPPPPLFYQKTWHPDPNKMVISSINLPFSQSVGFLSVWYHINMVLHFVRYFGKD